ncbi:MAG: uracil-DNA glycosylase, partial [Treponema sp.]|nr:uracil-DNA glycosylase [Treponema sp.]
MKAEQKEQLYQILKKSSGAILGYTAKEFAADPQFADDIEVAAAPLQGQSLPQEQNAPQAQVETQAQEQAPALASGGATIDSVNQKIFSCVRCGLSKTRKNVVPGEGVANPLVLVVGEGPGADED